MPDQGQFCRGGWRSYNACGLDIALVVRRTLTQIGHGDGRWGVDLDRLQLMTCLTRQSFEIGDAVDSGEELGAGDQGTVFGYACSETPSLMPAPIAIAHALMSKHKQVRFAEALGDFGPDAKAQATIRYEGGKPASISTLVLSTQHREDLDLATVRDMVRALIVEPELERLRVKADRILINPGGTFTLGGPVADAGLTGRKIIVDTYGGHCRHGGGAFSGKDPTKVDRSGAYGARQLAKTIVAAGLASHCEVRASYAIGHPEPVSVAFDTFGTGCSRDIEALLAHRGIDARTVLSPSSLIERLDLRRCLYAPVAAFGHFGSDGLPWERPMLAEQ
ncbi:methionine adenosyltransferase [Candidatus Viadribacter manganicus]|uniref:methionine adenosyltransferase n=1 Tax=Candidatus Viadribacter manganicus TaxID=1759059 RepID=UPI001D170083|nr:methionine adenosyltransferase [Candidatus Viadribacter manganicus]